MTPGNDQGGAATQRSGAAHPTPETAEASRSVIDQALGAFPSGHAAAEVAYVFGASLEALIVFLSLGTMVLLAHSSLIKAGKHRISDTLVGGMIGLAVVVLTAKAWPPQTGLGVRRGGDSDPQRSWDE